MLSRDCSVAFVADNTRVLRFTAPFTNGQAADGVLGQSDYTSEATGAPGEQQFSTIIRLQLHDFQNGSGILFILDQDNKRIVSGLTTWGNYSAQTSSPSSPPSFPSSPSVSSSNELNNNKTTKYILPCNATVSSETTCIVTQSIDLNLFNSTTNTIQFNYSVVIFEFDFTLHNYSHLILESFQQIYSNGPVYIAGSLTIILTAQDSNDLHSSSNYSIFLPFLTSNSSISGTFASIQVQDSSNTDYSSLQCLKGIEQTTPTTWEYSSF